MYTIHLQQFILQTIDSKIDSGIKTLNEQENKILRFHSKVSSDVLMEEIDILKNYLRLINKSLYWSHYFKTPGAQDVRFVCDPSFDIGPEEKIFADIYGQSVSMKNLSISMFTSSPLREFLLLSERIILKKEWEQTISGIINHIRRLWIYKSLYKVRIGILLLDEKSTVDSSDKGVFISIPGSCSIHLEFLTNIKVLFREILDSTKDNRFFVSKEPRYSPLLDAWMTIICFKFSHPKFKLITDDGKFSQTIVSCIDVDLSNYLDFLHNSFLDKNSRLSNGGRDDTNKYVILNQDKKAISMRISPEVFYNYTSITEPHLSRYTGFMTEKNLADYLNLGSQLSELYKVNLTKSSLSTISIESEVISYNYNVGIYNGGLKNNFYALFFYEVKNLDDQKSMIQQKVSISKYQISMLTLIFIMIVSGAVMCVSYKFQKRITRPLSKIIKFTKKLERSKNEDTLESTENVSRNQFPEGIYQTKEIMSLFSDILFGMTSVKSDKEDISSKRLLQVFPYNDLHKSSPYAQLVDWSESIELIKDVCLLFH